jgi:hypothetical protein
LFLAVDELRRMVGGERIEMELTKAVYSVADFFGFDWYEFFKYIGEDTLGGYHPDASKRTFDYGPWEVEMQFLYAIIRMIKPCHVLEIGNIWGNSTSHICAALRANGQGDLFSIDIADPYGENEGGFPFVRPEEFDDVAQFEIMDVFDFDFAGNNHFDLVFDDSAKTEQEVAHTWGNFAAHMPSGAVIVAHDSEHERLGPLVRAGIGHVLERHEYLSIQIEPALCGLAMWRKR